MGLAGKKQDLIGETVLAVGTFDLLHLPAQMKDSIKKKGKIKKHVTFKPHAPDISSSLFYHPN
jgi:hypothetical protein